MVQIDRQGGTGIELYRDSTGPALPAQPQKTPRCLPPGQLGLGHRLQQCFSAQVDLPVDGDEPRRQVGRFSGLQRQAEGVALGPGPEQHLPPQTGRIDAVQGHQAVGQAVIVDLNAGQRLPRFICHVQPQAAGILRRFDHHLAGGIAPGLRPAGAVDADSKGARRS